MKSQKAKKILHRVVCILVLSAYLVGTAASPFPAVSAAENNPPSSYSNDTPLQEGSEQNSLPSDPNQENQVNALGLSSDQPSRQSPSGEEVDKNKNPLGSDTVVLNRTYQLAFSMGDHTTPDNLKVYNNPIGYSKISFSNPLTTGSSSSASSFKLAWRKTVAVDTDGDGSQEVANIGYFNKELKLYISDFRNTSSGAATSSPIYTVAQPGYVTSHLLINDKNYTPFSGTVVMAAAGDFNHDGSDEIAIGFGSTIYLCKATKTSFKVLTKKDYGIAISSINALDTNNDGYSEMVAITSGNDSRAARLLFFDGAKSNGIIDLSAPSYSLGLDFTDNYYINASVDIGNLFGDGDKTIAIGGVTFKGTYCISYIKYDPDKEEYSETLSKAYSMQSDSKTSFQAMLNSYSIKCVSLAAPKDGTPEYVVLAGYIFLYNEKTDAFDRQTINIYTEDSDTPRANSDSTAESNISNVNRTKDEGIIMDTLAGNFDGNSSGKEQIIMLNYNEWYTHNDYIYLTQCYMNDKGEIIVNLREIYNYKQPNKLFPTICAVDVLNHSTKLKFIPSKSTFAYSNPVIVAILGASPYFEEIEDKYASLGNVSTTFGKASSTETSRSNGFSLSAGVSIGFEQGFGVFGIELFKIEMEATIKSNFTASWSTATSVEKSVAYTNYYTEDAVVMAVIPYDIYSYQATTWNSSTGKFETDEITLQIPYSPMTTMMTVEDYNDMAYSMDNAPIISEDVLKHTVGDPRTYPSSSKGLSNIEGLDVITMDATDAKSFTGTGIGNNSTEQSITNSSSSEKSFDFSLELEVTVKVVAGGVTAGVSGGTGYNTNLTITSTTSTTVTGSVASVPSALKQYQFNWALVAYCYVLQSKSGKPIQACPVVSYICKPFSSTYPPKVPQNLSKTLQDISGTSLRWDAADGATGYTILRSEEEEGSYTAVSDVTGKSTTSYTDTTGEQGKNYYYRIAAFKGTTSSIPSKSLYVLALTVNALQVKKQPKLTYKEYDTLDLSALIISLVMDNGTEVDVGYTDFAKYNLSADLQDGGELDSANNGIPLTITYAPSGLFVYTNKLVVKEVGEYPLLLTVNFTVGNTSNASYLAPGKMLTANINLENTTASATSAVIILALYNKDMTMVSHAAQTCNLAEDSTTNVSSSISLPSDVTGYIAKVFVWDGTSMTASNLIPLSDTDQIPY